MILVIDVGNTNTVFGVYDGKSFSIIGGWRQARERLLMSTGMFIVSLLSYEKIDVGKIEAVVIASVVPPIMYSLEHAIRKYFKLEPMVVGPGIKTGINIKYENPREVGADRIINAVAALELYGGPLIIVDFGTATTFCAVLQKVSI